MSTDAQATAIKEALIELWAQLIEEELLATLERERPERQSSGEEPPLDAG